MNSQDVLLQQLREFRTTEADLRRQLVDPVTELLIKDEKLKQMVAVAPDDYDYPLVREGMTEVIYLRQVIRDLLVPLIETQTRIQQVEAALRGRQGPSDGYTDGSHSTSFPTNQPQKANGHSSEQSE